MASDLRSSEWYAGDDRNAYIHRAWMRRGVPDDAFRGRPQIAIANTASDLTPCNAHLDEVAQSVKNGIYEAGGIPLEPAGRLARRDAGAPDRDAVAQHGGDGDGGDAPRQPDRRRRAAGRVRQDDSGAADGRGIRRPSRRRVPGGPMLTGHFRGEALGCGTDVWRLSEEVRAGTLSRGAVRASESSMIRAQGPLQHDGHGLDDGARRRGARHDRPRARGHAGPRQPAARGRRTRPGGWPSSWSPRTGARATFLTKARFHNAIVALAAIGGSTNAVVHLLAIAGRLGIDLTLDDFDRIGADVPLLVNLQPAGRYLMDDLYRAGGFLAVLREVRDLLDPTALTITGRPLVDYLDDARDLGRRT